MIDLHCHILHGIDDGPANIDESLAFARQAAADGIQAMVATPHICNGVYSGSAEDIEQKVETFNAELVKARIPLTVYPGAEVQLVPGLTELLRQGVASTINNSRYVLIELPPTFLPDSGKNELFSLRGQGYIPVIAHPERHLYLQRNFAYLADLVQMGALCQITAQSLTGDFGRMVQNAAEKMVENGLAHILATDSHSAEWRKPVLSNAVNKAARLLGSREKAVRMVTGVPEAIIADSDVNVAPPDLDAESDKTLWHNGRSSFFSSISDLWSGI